AEIGIEGDRLTWAQGASAAWAAIRALADVESGEMKDAFEDFHEYVEDCAEYYATARSMLMNIITEYGGKVDDFVERYGFKGDSPRRYKDLIAKIDAWILEDTRLRALVPPDPRVVPLAIVTQLGDRYDEMNRLYQAAYTEKEESSSAYDDKLTLYREDGFQLSVVFDAARLVWGVDDPKLRLLGFCPKSEIWTENHPHAPKNFAYDGVSGEFSWDEVLDVDSYEVMYRLTTKSGDWSALYAGTERSTTNKPPDPGVYDFRVRAIAGEKDGNWCTPITVDMSE
ncbi:MAG TPA: fibronectin type III domain-containing protein, partial [Alphaproteobacteria bacterium]|nr:fibronectin type III domain-containing protein [Alphaproteobacteria bacterium]